MSKQVVEITVRLYILVHFLLNKFGLRSRGLGRVQKMLKNEFVFKAFGKRIKFQPGIEGSYDYLLIGKSNEPETQTLLNKVLKNTSTFNFVDIGASVGEFVTYVSNYKNVHKIFAFEPRPDCAEVLRENAKLNNEDRITIFENAVDDVGNEEITIHLNPGGSSSGVYNLPKVMAIKSIKVNTITIDKALPDSLFNPICLIDVEGAEPEVMKGARNFIKKSKPLIIFEYNQTSKRYFQLEEVINILGPDYNIYCLRGDGKLDKNFENSWNCVAIPSNTIFQTILSTSIN